MALDASSAAGARILYAGISGRGAFQSTDGGQNWTQILGSATPAVATALGGGGFGKVLIALPPATSPPAAGGIQVLYVSLAGTGGAPDPVGLFISTNQGGTWTAQAGAGIPGNTQGGYSFHMAVDPASPGDGANDIIYLGAVGQARSTDSGANFTALAGMHADTHAWAFARQPAGTPTTVFCGNDGGLYRSTDGGATWIALNAGGLQTTLFYNMAVKPDATASVTLGAAQDNGVQTTSGATAPAWSSPQGGDGWDVEYDGVTAGRAYATSGFWDTFPSTTPPCTRVFASTADGTDLTPGSDITPWGTTTDQGCYLASVATDPSAAGIVYAAGNQNLWQSRDAGSTWQIVGAFPATGLITARASVAPTNGNNVVVALGAQVSVSTNALTTPATNVTFTNITRNLPSRSVLRAIFDPNDPSVVYAVLGGFNGSAPGQSGHVFRTTIGGTAWTDISAELDAPVGALALDGTDTPTTIYIGTDLGVLRSVDGGATWYVLDDIHFPRAPVTDLVIGRGSGILRAATYGRGVFEFAQANGPVIAVNLENGFEFRTSGEELTRLTLQVFNVGTADLVIHSLQRLNGSREFEVDPFPATPLVIAAGSEVDFTVRYTPTPGAAGVATIRIRSSDPGAPELDLVATAVPLPEQRVTEGLITLYTFAAGSGKVVADVSGSGAALDLTISDPNKVDWLPGGGLAIRGDVLIASAGPAAKVIDTCKTSGELTIEAWVKPETTTQSGPARIVTLSRDVLHRNFTLGEGLWGSQPTDVYDVPAQDDGDRRQRPPVDHLGAGHGQDGPQPRRVHARRRRHYDDLSGRRERPDRQGWRHLRQLGCELSLGAGQRAGRPPAVARRLPARGALPPGAQHRRGPAQLHGRPRPVARSKRVKFSGG